MGRRSPFTKTQKRDAVLSVLAGRQTVSEVYRDCFDRSILGWCFARRCRAVDVIIAVNMAWSTTWPHGIDPADVGVTLPHDIHTQSRLDRAVVVQLAA